MKGKHSLDVTGTCSNCGRRRPRGPCKVLPAQHNGPVSTAGGNGSGEALPAVAPIGPTDLPPSGSVDRLERLRSMFAPPPPVVVPRPEPEEPEPEPEPKRTVGLRKHDWQWVASTATEGIDVAAGWAIDRWSDLQPLEASESSRKKFSETLAVFGEQRLGKLEVPTWIVLIICLIAMLVSKIVGAPRKASIAAEKVRSAPLVQAEPVVAADSSAPADASAADKPETPPPSKPTIQPPTIGDGSAEDVPNGF